MSQAYETKSAINFFTKEERESYEKACSLKDNSELNQERASCQIISNTFGSHMYKNKPIESTVLQQSMATITDIRTTQRSMNGFNTIAKKAKAKGEQEGQSILEKFSQNYYGDKIIQDSYGLNPLNSINDFNKFEEKKSSQFLESQRIAQSEQQFNNLQQRVGTETAAPGSRPIYDKNSYGANFNNNGSINIGGVFKTDSIQLLKTCFPCEFRKLDFTSKFSNPALAVASDMEKKWKEIEKMLKDLTVFNPGEFSKDFCELFKFLDGQCIPDITGLISLLTLMYNKYLDTSAISLSNIVGQLIGPFLSPVVGSFVSNLDQYIDLIVDPLRCVVDNLEKNIIALQDQINGAYNIADMNMNKFRKKEIEFYDAKIKSLRNRLIEIEREGQERSDRINNVNPAVRNLDGRVVNGQVYPRYSESELKNIDLDRSERIIQTKLVAGGIKVGGVTNSSFFKDKAFGDDQGNWQLKNSEEKENIKLEIKKLERKRQEKYKDIGDNSDYTPIQFDRAISFSQKQRVALNNFEKSSKSLIGDLTDAINDGINIIKQSVEIYRDELLRLMLGRVSNQQDQIEYARLVQRISRLISIVSAVENMKKANYNMKRFCEGGPEKALQEVVKRVKDNQSLSGELVDFYQAQNADGDPLIVMAPGGAKLGVSSIEFEDLGNDALLDGISDIDSVTKTVTFNDLNEVDRLNREGIVPDLGNIDSKKIEINADVKVGSALDLHFKTSYAIISNEFCSKSAINFGSSDTVKKWAEGLWQKN